MNRFDLAERGWLPDGLIRLGVRRMLRERLASLRTADPADELTAKSTFLRELAEGPIALSPEAANDQHYELPARFFELVLGRRAKYSSGLWPAGVSDLDSAEARMLDLTCRRAGLEDEMRVLDLGCGWGSLTLWIAEHYPRTRVLAVSNSKPQREHILGRLDALGLYNVEVVTRDMNGFDPGDRFDRIVSVEMFEHMRNWPALLGHVARWLEPDGRAFLHVFCHREHAYPFESRGEGDWMARHFFTGGMMPSEDLILRCQRDLSVERQWRVSGLHYHRTCDAWLANLDTEREAVLGVLAETYGRDEAERWLQRWRLFFLACSELFAFGQGSEWFVSHVRLAPHGRDRS